MTEAQKTVLKTALVPNEIGTVIATRTMKRLRSDGVVDTVTLEIGTPREIQVPSGPNQTTWVCNARISLVPRILAMTGASSLDAILNVTYLAAGVLAKLPMASEIDMSLLPFFALPVNPITTTPEQLAAEQQRPKEIRSASISVTSTLPSSPNG